MRVDVTKVLFIGLASNKEEFLKAFQHAGIAQFLGSKVTVSDLLSSDFQEVVYAMKILKGYSVEQKQNIVIPDPLSFARRIISEKLSLDELHAKLKTLRAKFEFVEPLGKIPLRDIHSLEQDAPIHFRLWVASKKKNMLVNCPFLIPIAETAEQEYFVSLTDEEIEIPAGLEAIPLTSDLTELAETIQQIQIKISFLEHELKRKSALLASLKKALIDQLNETKKDRIAETAYSALDQHLFAMTAWIPTQQVAEAQELSKTLNVFSDTLDLAPGETPPTHLENDHLARIGEDLVDIYDTPAYTDKDPSLWVVLFFSLFFAMIVGDGGYGLVFFITALLLRKRADSPPAKRAVTLTGFLGITCIIWGLCTNSFFSMELAPNNPLRAYSPLTYLVHTKGAYHMQDPNDELILKWRDKRAGLLPASVEQFLYEPAEPQLAPLAEKIRDSLLMELSIIVGVIHIMFSMLRYIKRNIAYIGWTIAIIGGYLCCAHYLEAKSIIYALTNIDPAHSAHIGIQLVGGGVLFALIAALIKRGISGLSEIMTVVQIFGDILSYLRIYALALAGALIGSMANKLAGNMPFLIAALLIGFSHAVNIILSAVGGLIHGLRLNFLEWYHYCFEGGGKRFYPFKIETFR